MSKFAADLDGMLAFLDRNGVLDVPIRVRRKVLGTVKCGSNHRCATVAKAGDHDAWQAAGQRICNARVDAIAARGSVDVDVDELKGGAVIAKPRFVHYV